MFSLLPISQGKIYECGGGWGHLSVPLSKRFEVTSFEISPVPWFISRLLQGITGAKFKNVRKDFFTCSLKEADGVVCYLYPGAMERLASKFENELKPGAFVISNTFALPGWEAKKVVETGGIWPSKIYLYEKK